MLVLDNTTQAPAFPSSPLSLRAPWSTIVIILREVGDHKRAPLPTIESFHAPVTSQRPPHGTPSSPGCLVTNTPVLRELKSNALKYGTYYVCVILIYIILYMVGRLSTGVVG